jgi:dienelactone hydrolase
MALPGDAVLPLGHLHIVDVHSGEVRAAQVPPITRMTYDPFATRLDWWSGDSRRLYALHVHRGGRRVSLHMADATTGAGSERIGESGDSFVFPRHVPLANTNVHEFDPGDGRPPRWTWFSQRSGWVHLERHGGAPGRPPQVLTAGEWTVRDVVHVDAAGGWIWFTACGREPGRGPCLRHLYRVRADGSGLQLLTPEDADHEVRVAPDGQCFVDALSRVDLPPVTLLRRADGTLVADLERADADALAAAGFRPPLRAAVKARRGVTDLHGCLFLPSGFDPAKRYPLVDSVYPGPQMIRTPQAFAGGEALRLYWQDQALAELGFVVLALDGLGTPFRSKAFVDHAAGRGFGEAGGLADHVAAVAQLADRHPWIGATRAGIGGHSGGGCAAARAMMQFPGVFRVGVATAGNHDQRGYDAGWGEFWIGRPEGDNYDDQDNLHLAARLRGRLLLMHGEMDENVHPALTMRLVDALIAANKVRPAARAHAQPVRAEGDADALRELRDLETTGDAPHLATSGWTKARCPEASAPANGPRPRRFSPAASAAPPPRATSCQALAGSSAGIGSSTHSGLKGARSLMRATASPDDQAWLASIMITASSPSASRISRKLARSSRGSKPTLNLKAR